MADGLSFGQQAAISGGSGALDWAGNSISMNSANSKNKRNAWTQLWMQQYLMDRQNEYNKPVNQMKRLEEAGLNPNLVYGSGNAVIGAASGSAGSVGTVSNSRMSFDFLSKMSMLNAMKQQNAQTRSINANVDIAKADLELRKELTYAQIANLAASSRNTNASATYREADNAFLDSLGTSRTGANFGAKVVEGLLRFIGR